VCFGFHVSRQRRSVLFLALLFQLLLAVPDASQPQTEDVEGMTGVGSWEVWAVSAAAFSTAVLALEMFPIQLAAFLHVIVPPACLFWLVKFSRASWASCHLAIVAAQAAAAQLAERITAQRAAAAAAAVMPNSKVAAKHPATGTGMNGSASPDLLSPPLTPLAKRKAGSTEAPAGSLTPAAAAAAAAGKPGAQGAAAAATANGSAATAGPTSDEPPKPSGRQGRTASGGRTPTGTPTRRGGTKAARGSAAAFAAALVEEHDGQQQQHQEAEEPEHSDAATHLPAAKRKRAAGGRAKKSAAAAAVAEEEGHDKEGRTARATADAAVVGHTDEAGKAARADAEAANCRHETAPGDVKGRPAADAADPSGGRPAGAGQEAGGSSSSSSLWDALQAALSSGSLLLEQLQPWLPAAWAVLGAVVLLGVFVCGLPAVLQPAGYSQAALR
jgi:hypothetical protein